jgi:hypothetical protein
VKTTILVALVAMAVAGCGGGDARSDARSSEAIAPVDARADLWAEQVFAIYGAAAVQTCLAAFHTDYQASVTDSVSGPFVKPVVDYRAALSEFMCACARGQSPLPCPQP